MIYVVLVEVFQYNLLCTNEIDKVGCKKKVVRKGCKKLVVRKDSKKLGLRKNNRRQKNTHKNPRAFKYTFQKKRIVWLLPK